MNVDKEKIIELLQKSCDLPVRRIKDILERAEVLAAERKNKYMVKIRSARDTDADFSITVEAFSAADAVTQANLEYEGHTPKLKVVGVYPLIKG